MEKGMQTIKCDISIRMITFSFGLVNNVMFLISFHQTYMKSQ